MCLIFSLFLFFTDVACAQEDNGVRLYVGPGSVFPRAGTGVPPPVIRDEVDARNLGGQLYPAIPGSHIALPRAADGSCTFKEGKHIIATVSPSTSGKFGEGGHGTVGARFLPDDCALEVVINTWVIEPVPPELEEILRLEQQLRE